VTSKKKASDSLARLRSGIARETPATRARASESTSSEAVGETRPPEKPARGRRGRPPSPKPERLVRVSVDLPRSRHKFLRDFAYDAETDGMSVMRALLLEMADDPNLQARVRDRLART
jgi:hypothetical protein